MREYVESTDKRLQSSCNREDNTSGSCIGNVDGRIDPAGSTSSLRSTNSFDDRERCQEQTYATSVCDCSAITDPPDHQRQVYSVRPSTM